MMRVKHLRASLKGCLSGLLLTMACAVWAQGKAEPTSPPQASTQYALGLDELHQTTLSLRGVDGRKEIVFGIREDERIDSLNLDIAYSYSAALLRDLSHLNVLLNGQTVATVTLPQESQDTLEHAIVHLPVHLLKPYNTVQLQLIGHYTLSCEDPLHADLWADIDPSSRLLIESVPLQLPDDLGLLPRPFFDSRDLRKQKLQLVLPKTTEKRLEAAGILASWMGALSDFRGTEFAVSLNKAPEQGHAIVILQPNDALPEVSVPTAIQGPTIAMRTNPHDPTGKLLLVMGRNDDEIRDAATSLALSAQSLSGATSAIEALTLTPRQPYDAPNWIATDGPVSLGTLLPSDQFTVEGFDPKTIEIGLRLPPDLSDWHTGSAQLDLRYRHSPIKRHEEAALDVLINQHPLQRIELSGGTQATWDIIQFNLGATKQSIELPLSSLESQASLGFKFSYPKPWRDECSGSILDTRRSAIDPSSTIDLSTLRHHLAMPDLAAFRTSGFPFSRMSDLSETVAILPTHVTEHDLVAFLSILGNIGASTGYPATGLRVQHDAENLQEKDILLIESGAMSPTLASWSSYLPNPSTSEGGRGWLFTTLKLLGKVMGVTPHSPADVSSKGAYVAGFESPITAGRSVIVVAGVDEADLQNSVDIMLFDKQQARDFQGAFVTVRDGEVLALSHEKTYYAGSLGFYLGTLWFLSRNPIILFLILLAGALAIATISYVSLRARARKRLFQSSSDEQRPYDEE